MIVSSGRIWCHGGISRLGTWQVPFFGSSGSSICVFAVLMVKFEVRDAVVGIFQGIYFKAVLGGSCHLSLVCIAG